MARPVWRILVVWVGGRAMAWHGSFSGSVSEPSFAAGSGSVPFASRFRLVRPTAKAMSSGPCANLHFPKVFAIAALGLPGLPGVPWHSQGVPEGSLALPREPHGSPLNLGEPKGAPGNPPGNPREPLGGRHGEQIFTSLYKIASGETGA